MSTIMNLLNFLIASLFSLLLIAQNANCHKHSTQPLMLLISFDGFRWDYLKMHNLTNFNYIKNLGSHAEYITNAFSTVTFPNHWTIVTGLNEESHGIMQNYMYDPVLRKKFDFTSPESQTIDWYGQNSKIEPIWTSNQKGGNGRRSAAEWVGSGVVFGDQKIINIPYNKSRPYLELIDQFIKLYTDEHDPINFGALYFDEPDHTGHVYGPYSKEMKEKLQYLDGVLGYLIDQLKSHHLFDKLNLIITSDHGMDTISNDTAIYLDLYIDVDLFEAFGSRAVNTVFVKKETDIEYVYKTFKAIPNVDVYMKHEIPEELHYKNNVRAGDMIIVAKLGYAVYVKSQDINWKLNNGDHGYYNNLSSMHPIFMAHGPAFKKSYEIKSFRNVDIYPMMCFILGVKAAPHNGTLENVLDMLVYNTINVSFNYYLLLLILIPIGIVLMTFFFACTLKKTKNKDGAASSILPASNNGYMGLATSDASLTINLEQNHLGDSKIRLSNTRQFMGHR